MGFAVIELMCLIGFGVEWGIMTEKEWLVFEVGVVVAVTYVQVIDLRLKRDWSALRGVKALGRVGNWPNGQVAHVVEVGVIAAA